MESHNTLIQVPVGVLPTSIPPVVPPPRHPACSRRIARVPRRDIRSHVRRNWQAKLGYAHRLFQCVAVASRPLRVKELAEFLVFDFDTDSTGTTPFHTSSAYGQPGSAQVLLEHGADVHAKGMDGVTPLHWASNEQVARILLDHGADSNAKDDFSRTPLREARVQRRPEVARLLLERGAEEHNADEMINTTPLHTAPAAGQLAVVTKLLKSGADVNAQRKR